MFMTVLFLNCCLSSRFAYSQMNNVRLVGGNSSTEGRVEVFYNGEWGTVCDDYFDDNDAAVVCSTLGYSSTNAKAKQNAFFGQGNGTIWMDDLRCTDNDTNIFNCSQNRFGIHNCGHHEDAGVMCYISTDFKEQMSCNDQQEYGILWGTTIAGITAEEPCPENQKGRQKATTVF
nr:neurotrypsin-like [Crassostrea gigas]